MNNNAKQALEQLAKAADGNKEAKAFFEGIKYGMKYAAVNKEGSK